MNESTAAAMQRLAGPVPDSCLDGIDERAAALQAVAGHLEAQTDEHAERMAREMGKPIAQGKAEVEKCAWVCRYYADQARDFLADTAVETDNPESLVTCAPLGIVLAVMPWNFPYWQVFRFAAPAIMAGNRVLLKHASIVSGCGAAIDTLVREASGRDDLLAFAEIPSNEVAGLIADPRVAAVTFTGSTDAGREVAAACGRHLKKSVLELGGSDPYLVLDDADLPHAAAVCAKARMISNGQSCIAAKRFIVTRSVHDEFVELLRDELSRYQMGDPLDPATKLGPLARHDLRDDLHAQVRGGVASGAHLELGGQVPEEKGAWYPATLVTGVRPGSPLFDEETFGPVAAVIRAADTAEAVELANRSAFGLGAAVFTRDTALARRVARQLRAGTVAINTQVVSDPRLPFGGIRDSGWGRELGREGIREFVNVKTIVRGDGSGSHH